MQLAAEIRYPFLDLRLVRYLLRLPQIPWAIEKSLLRVAMKGLLPPQILRRPKAPLAGNPWAALLPPAPSRWWDEYLIPAPGLEEFVDVEVAKATLATVSRHAQARNQHTDIDILRSSLRPIGLNLWLRQTACARFNAADQVHQEVT
jgi:asparagine synthase (glutamine-hydrolysing)